MLLSHPEINFVPAIRDKVTSAEMKYSQQGYNIYCFPAEDFISRLVISINNTTANFITIWARDLKNSGKSGSGLSCRWTLFTTWAFGFKLHLIFHRVEFKKPVWYSIWWIFMVGIAAFRVFMRTRHNIEPYSPLKPTKVGFIS